MKYNPFYRGLAKWRAKKIKAEANSLYAGMVHHCQRLSQFDNQFAFVIKHKGTFGGPDIMQINRPDNLSISEFDNCVVIKDGKIYELKNEAI